MSIGWYDDHWKERETADFRHWFLNEYGYADDYECQDEYWVRRGFALMGWIGRMEPCNASIISTK